MLEPQRIRRVLLSPLTLAVLLAIGAVSTAATQDPAQPPQQAPPPAPFRSAVDLVPVDVNVIDNGGRPVTGLEAGDFVLTVDGKPRRVASAEYISASTSLTPLAPGDPAPTPALFSSNAAAGGGRLIMIVVDQANIGVGRGRQLLESARAFVMGLGPSDRVGLVAFPGSGPQVDFTANHAIVATLLPKLMGQANPIQTQYRVGIAEAFRLQRGDNRALNEVVARECSAENTQQDLDVCRNQVAAEAATIYHGARERTQNSMLSLRYLIEKLALTPAPKTVVFVSEGLVIDRDYSELSWVGPTAARGQVVIYAFHLNEPYSDASSRGISPTRSEDLALGEDGLSFMAGLTRGTVMRIVGNGDAQFKRLGLELSAYYLLSFEPEAGDRDGKPHKIKVELPKRRGIDIRARSEFSVSGPAAKTTDAALADLLQTPLLATDIGLKLSTYTLRDPASSKLRILMAAEIDRTLNPDGKLALAYTLVDDKGRLIGSQLDPEVTTPIHPETKRQTYTGFILSDVQGPHTLKIAVLDDRGRRGSVEYTFRAALTSIGQLRITDLLIADSQKSTGGSATPVIASDFTSGMMTGYVELYSEAPEVLNTASVVFDVAQSEQGRALDGAMGKVTPATESPNRRAIEGSVSLALLPPGDYVARAIVSVDGRKVGQVTRPLRVGRMVSAPKTTSTTNLALRSASSRAPIPFASRIEKFERSSVLTPQVVNFFVERMNFGARGEANAAPAIEHAQAGRFDEAVKTLSAGGTSVPSTFLSGLALYARGELEPAAAKFRETLRLDSEFFPAAFYLGSCYAAGGRDSEAVGAWQMSLITESEAPFIYTLLSDALLRLKEVDHALEILNEAAGEWPDNDEVQVRLGSALAMAGKRADALQKLEPYLAKHPEDVDRHFVALRTLYEARSEGKPVRSQAEDRALFARWAAAYTAGKGPQQALVDQWQKAISK